jgi:LAO/AO transport system kinase
VFIRSMATRGSLGGLSRKAQEAADVLDAFGKDYIIYETVGVGQSELDIVEAADTVIVTLVPESGDSVQAMKAGLMEIANIFVMNKSDREGAARAMRELEAMIHLRPAADWMPPVLATVASEGKGIGEVRAKIAEHRTFLETGERLTDKRKKRLIKKVHELVSRRLKQEFWDEQAERLLQENLQNFQSKKISPYQLSEQLMTNFKASLGEKLRQR